MEMEIKILQIVESVIIFLEAPAEKQREEKPGQFMEKLDAEVFDVAFVQPFDYVRIADRYGYRPLATRTEMLEAILVIEHNVDFLLPLAHRLLCLDRGALIAAGAPRAVVTDRKVVAAYFGDATAAEATPWPRHS